MEKMLSIFTSRPVEFVESEGFFKKHFRLIFLLAAAVVAVYGIYNIINLSIDYFKIVFDLEAFPIIRHLILYVFCLIISIIVFVFVAGALFQRAKMILADSTTNLVDIMPGVFKTFGIISAIVPLAIGIIGLLAAILAANPFLPIAGIYGVIAKISLIDMPTILFGFGVADFSDYIKQLFGSGFLLLIVGVFVAFFNIVALYLVSALYKLVVDFLRK
ncbi:MAG TPA: hypothetical protein PKN32_02155 [Bacteroidales bacterium]|nr:hypothetical protein [Bacteroidales bacterium]